MGAPPPAPATANLRSRGLARDTLPRVRGREESGRNTGTREKRKKKRDAGDALRRAARPRVRPRASAAFPFPPAAPRVSPRSHPRGRRPTIKRRSRRRGRSDRLGGDRDGKGLVGGRLPRGIHARKGRALRGVARRSRGGGDGLRRRESRRRAGTVRSRADRTRGGGSGRGRAGGASGRTGAPTVVAQVRGAGRIPRPPSVSRVRGPRHARRGRGNPRRRANDATGGGKRAKRRDGRFHPPPRVARRWSRADARRR